MRIAITGAGTLGASLAARLAASDFTTEIHWINRNIRKVQAGAVDIQHGLALSPSCRRVQAYAMDDLDRALGRSDALVLTHGGGVAPNGTRDQLYGKNCDLMREAVTSALRGFAGTVLVATNPVDLLTRYIWAEADLSERQIFGLGTVVETARLRWSLARYLTPPRSPSEIHAYAIGTHDENFVMVLPQPLAPGAGGADALPEGLLSSVHGEVVKAAGRVKANAGNEGDKTGAPPRGTMYPVVEGIVSVLDAVALDRGTTHTVSVLDAQDDDRLFYSMPCVLGREGIRTKLTGDLADPTVLAGLAKCREMLRESFHRAT